MHIQVITFRVEGTDPVQFERYGRAFELGLRDMPGLVSEVCLENQAENIHGGVCIWEDGAALTAFRHSELYARLAMSPLVEDFEDRDMSAVRRATRDLLLAA